MELTKERAETLRNISALLMHTRPASANDLLEIARDIEAQAPQAALTVMEVRNSLFSIVTGNQNLQDCEVVAEAILSRRTAQPAESVQAAPTMEEIADEAPAPHAYVQGKDVFDSRGPDFICKAVTGAMAMQISDLFNAHYAAPAPSGDVIERMMKCIDTITRKERTTMSKIPQALSPGEEAFALHCQVEHLYPEREFMFHPDRKWRFDFAWPEQKIAVEVEGIGRHQSFDGFLADCGKYNSAAKMGWRVLRYTPAMVRAGVAINDVMEILNA